MEAEADATRISSLWARRYEPKGRNARTLRAQAKPVHWRTVCARLSYQADSRVDNLVPGHVLLWLMTSDQQNHHQLEATS